MVGENVRYVSTPMMWFSSHRPSTDSEGERITHIFRSFFVGGGKEGNVFL